MKVNDIRAQIEKSNHPDEQFFSIEDQSMIFDILRSKMYSNPIAAICREVSCNARDAHREAGKPDVPIVIHLPNSSEPFYKIKDFGPGISPDRMSNIFIKYTASTKRGDNTQTGGFGLGAKTPFSYSNTFNIKTNYNGKQYNYICFIDETKIGKLSLISEYDTNEENGTEIIVPVQNSNFRSFADQTEFCTRHWKVKPIIKGGNISWAQELPIYSGNNWSITSSNDWNKTVKLIIDEIEYPVDTSALKSYANMDLIESSRGNVFLYFGVGDLSLSANREQIYLDKPTQAKISERINNITSDLKKEVYSEIKKCANLKEANTYYKEFLNKAFRSLDFLGTVYWESIPLVYSYNNIGCTVLTFMKGRFSRRLGSEPNKISRSSGTSINFESNSEIYINDLDLKEVTNRHVRAAFDNDPKLKQLQVICPTDKISVNYLNANFNLDKLSAKTLSSITKTSNRKKSPSSNRLLVYKFSPEECIFKQVSYSSIDNDHSNKVMCLFNKSKYYDKVIELENGLTLTQSTIRDLLTIGGKEKYSFYCLDISIPKSRIAEDFSNFQSIDSFIKEKVIDRDYSFFVKTKLFQELNKQSDQNFVNVFYKYIGKITDKNSIFLKRLEQHIKYLRLPLVDLKVLNIYELIKGAVSQLDVDNLLASSNDYSLEILDEEYSKKYPLIKSISSYNITSAASDVIDYVNLVDAKK